MIGGGRARPEIQTLEPSCWGQTLICGKCDFRQLNDLPRVPCLFLRADDAFCHLEGVGPLGPLVMLVGYSVVIHAYLI